MSTAAIPAVAAAPAQVAAPAPVAPAPVAAPAPVVVAETSVVAESKAVEAAAEPKAEAAAVEVKDAESWFKKNQTLVLGGGVLLLVIIIIVVIVFVSTGTTTAEDPVVKTNAALAGGSGPTTAAPWAPPPVTGDGGTTEPDPGPNPGEPPVYPPVAEPGDEPGIRVGTTVVFAATDYYLKFTGGYMSKFLDKDGSVLLTPDLHSAAPVQIVPDETGRAFRIRAGVVFLGRKDTDAATAAIVAHRPSDPLQGPLPAEWGYFRPFGSGLKDHKTGSVLAAHKCAEEDAVYRAPLFYDSADAMADFRPCSRRETNWKKCAPHVKGTSYNKDTGTFSGDGVMDCEGKPSQIHCNNTFGVGNTYQWGSAKFAKCILGEIPTCCPIYKEAEQTFLAVSFEPVDSVSV